MEGNGHHNANNRIEAFIEEARKAGYATLDDILDHLPDPDTDISRLEDVLRRLDEAGVEVCEEDETATETDEPTRLSYVADDDAITLYFREVGATPLLTREQEVALARQIEQGEAAKQRLKSETLPAAERATLEQLVQAGEAARHKLITANARLVVSLAKNYLGQGVPLLDLIQEGNIGLMRAAEKFDWRRGHKFSTYATWWIRQALTRAVADQGRTIRLPVHRQEQVRKLRKATRELTKELGREPTPEELAERLGDTPDEIERLIQHAQRPMSLEKPVMEHGGSQFGEFLESGDPLPVDVIEEEALAHDIQTLLGALPSREARIIELRYGLRDGREYTLKEVGERFGLTRERIRQIENDALHRLRRPQRLQKLRAYLT
ncbi:MAG: sigma-70 family RNA polymerase sigma factor [Chloroflexi bacterium]|nr:MAG: sigma-70 family RNA polymerase sigma factor [Chloroflexota bacterium]